MMKRTSMMSTSITGLLLALLTATAWAVAPRYENTTDIPGIDYYP